MSTILIAIDQTLMREGLKLILDPEQDLEVVALARNCQEAFSLAEKHRPDLVLIGVQLQGSDGIECTRRIKVAFPDTIVLIMTSFGEDEPIIEGFTYGANGFLPHDMPGARLISSLRDALRGELMMPASVTARLATRLGNMFTNAQTERLGKRWKRKGIQLNEREKEIALLLVRGWNNRQIAGALNFSEGTVKNYISAIYQKIGVRDRPNAILALQDADIGSSAGLDAWPDGPEGKAVGRSGGVQPLD